MVLQRRRLLQIPSSCVNRLFVSMAALTLSLLFAVAPASAMYKMETKTINAALVYGMRNQKLGLAALLGPNWVEGDNGALLNIYSPFMVLATKSARGGFPLKPSKSDLEEARKKYAKWVAHYSDPKNKPEVKFAINFYGKSPTFAKTYSARIVGFGRGKEFTVKPSKQHLDEIADPVVNGQSHGQFEAINSYYFRFPDIEDLQEFRLILESPNGETLVFRLNNEKLY